jgi:hypothetical protein
MDMTMSSIRPNRVEVVTSVQRPQVRESQCSNASCGFAFCRFGRLVAVSVQIRDGRRLSRSGQEPRHWPLRLCQWARPQLAPSLLGRPHSTVRPSQDCVPSSKDAFANGGGRHFAAAEAASP